MTNEEMLQCASELESKAEDIRQGGYGPSEPGEDESWMGDLIHAAYLLREGRMEELDQAEREEIEAMGYELEEAAEADEAQCLLAACQICQEPVCEDCWTAHMQDHGALSLADKS